jgi:hypothetical protein
MPLPFLIYISDNVSTRTYKKQKSLPKTDRLSFYIIQIYFANGDSTGVSVGVDGAEGASAGASAGAVGAVGAIAASSTLFCNIDCDASNLGAPSNICDAKLKTTKAIANVHVAFSRKSVVLRTPITWLLEANVELNPPPLEFWTNTISIIKMAAINVSTVTRIPITC